MAGTVHELFPVRLGSGLIESIDAAGAGQRGLHRALEVQGIIQSALATRSQITDREAAATSRRLAEVARTLSAGADGDLELIEAAGRVALAANIYGGRL